MFGSGGKTGVCQAGNVALDVPDWGGSFGVLGEGFTGLTMDVRSLNREVHMYYTYVLATPEDTHAVDKKGGTY